MTSRLRKLALTAHITASVGWLGAVVGFLALAIAGMATDEPRTASAAYVAMEATGWFVLAPLALASLVTGLIESLSSRWGLFRHYWVLFKLVINVVATVVLLLYLQTLQTLAELARSAEGQQRDLSSVQTLSPVLHAGAAILLLLTATTLAVYKPRGLTRFGRRQPHARPIGGR